MSSIKHYCILQDLCDIVGKEKASIHSRGFLSVSWRTRNRANAVISILTLHVKARNTFMECYA
jgi:hypothetical protein